MSNKADHLFISYAGEDWVFAEWLARKLASEGYSIWFDRFKLLGGESYPRDIDIAIKDRTFRLLALLSRNSINKPNPLKERTLALNISREKGIDFLIPLNLDGLSATELDWMTNDLTFIPFHQGWTQGLRQLKKRLKSINTPKSLQEGRRLSLQTYEPKIRLEGSDEQLISNVFPIISFPSHIYKYDLRKSIDKIEKSNLRSRWAYLSKGPKELLTFQIPPGDFDMNKVVTFEKYALNKEKLDGMEIKYIISALLHKSIWNEFLRLGCREIIETPILYFPSGILKQDRIEFRNYTGRKTYVYATGTREYRSQGESTTYYYHLCPVIRIRQDFNQPFCLQLSTRLHIADKYGNPLTARSAFSRRKRIAKSWFNHQWLSRMLAIHSFLAQGNENVVIEDRLNGSSIVISEMLRALIPVGIEDVTQQIEESVSVTDDDLEDGG